jgi:hypothetical protein
MTEDFETQIQAIAQNLAYPPTPQFQMVPPARPRSTGWPRAALILLMLGLFSMAVPQIRAAVLEFLRIGAVTIYLDGTTESGEPLNLDEISGATDLVTAQTLVMFPLHIALDDPPDRVFVQDHSLVIFVWLNGSTIDRALYQISSYDWRMVKSANPITHTEVGTQSAVWVEIQHPIQFLKDGVVRTELSHFVMGHVLIWEQDNVTYRLETPMSLEDARRFAESLTPMSE